MGETVRWGIIGCGDVTEVKSGPGFQKAEGSELVAVMRRDAVKARDYAERHQVPRWYDSANDLIRDSEVDAIYIATPPAYHKEYTIAAALAGKPVYVEKPMARNYQECLDMLEACERSGVPLFVAYYRRALPRFLKVKELLDQGAIGEVRFVTTRQTAPLELAEGDELPWRLVPELSGGGLFFDLASHTLDLLDFLLGPIVSASGIATNQGGRYAAEDTVTGVFRFASGAHGTGTWCFAADEREDMNEIVGSKGRLLFSTFGHEPVKWKSADGVREFPFERPMHIQQPLIQQIADQLRGRGACVSMGESGARTNWVMDELTKRRDEE
ncbi:gfo/Idh/MocA family oxidoreductase [Xylanibacillus composti]|uniref:Oxidoreductase n=1 Tax=Xylanibacillus composti TaxID=1572762 RepID=A0A8J4M4A7_9BACL|nr:Gfo/Idh/MocA family oxidoreductase [Xylanibacillus composti]MDT9726375.1 gfo/Idh/MocA family oxidoreductase [Xylanibacillus composti]GIQ70386.1 oxidoreductase [Xylanibacillus composti]